ncbi:hypothetical protein KIH27_17835 [Mycobacterium sp. M1]|uniref:Secreted protein n=1 Tax=Mycolicibacter acidiphilus TaxID=2835306 RepID=A0ABS5RPD3_9MYCO|nr:hypothetical protein [Mycolicibacter acidiphilus]MBS9535449.1 hypothetical protein [Mycolicibacter acidiphilus]
MRCGAIATVATLPVAVAMTAAAAAQATRSEYVFQSPSGNIVCDLHATDTGPGAFVYCVVRDHSWSSPLPPSYCPDGRPPETLVLNAGSPAALTCHPAPWAPAATLDYGQSRSVPPVDCVSQLTGITCSDTDTGHFFRASRETCQLG